MIKHIAITASAMLVVTPAIASEHEHGNNHAELTSMHADHEAVTDKEIAHQRKALAKNTKGKGFGPQSPRNIDSAAGRNHRIFDAAPAYTKMNLCNIHFHKNAEHKAKDFSIYAGNGDGHGYQSGYKYDTANLSKSELAPTRPDARLLPEQRYH